jgi:hypothetical protein
MFHYALDAYIDDDGAEPDEYWDDMDDQNRWLAMDAEERLMKISGKLWRCTDILPGETCDILDLPPGSTYAQGCRKIRRGYVTPAESV